MGGFAGGDEGGYWDDDNTSLSKSKSKKSNTIKSNIQINNSIYSIKAYAKVNIFLKITGHKNGYHTLISRFMRVQSLYDTISFVPFKCKTFTIEGCEDIPLESNTIYKAYKALLNSTDSLDIDDFFYEHKVVVKKCIPSQAGLGGGSSDAAAFMLLVKEVCNLILSTKELAVISSTIGADLPFFIYNYPSANVSGFGEIVELFEEELLNIKLYTPKIKCDTSLVYKTFKKHLLKDISLSSFDGLEKLSSKNILNLYSNPEELNDLYKAAIIAYPNLKKQSKNTWFFSGSGSTFFKV